MKYAIYLLLGFLIGFAPAVLAREGMFLPKLIAQRINEMQTMGFALEAGDIYNEEQASMKDAIVQFGGGCTGELISPEGLLLTNHHCGYRQIQRHSSIDDNYLRDGFWARNRGEELPNPGLTVTFLIRMEEVTDRVLEGTDSLVVASEIEYKKQSNIFRLVAEAEKDSPYEADVKAFYEGNQYYLLVTETFRDVRLVGAPPSSIGKFGGDTDNWMWPRHTGDFSLFRIYAGKDNQPADYSPDNVPYRPRHYFPIKTSGINEGDFTMVFGFPGRTDQYLPSHALRQIVEQDNPVKIAVRDLKIRILQTAMSADEEIRIRYAAKYASTSNAWKKWKGERLGLERLGAIPHKENEEQIFRDWVQSDSLRTLRYGNIFPAFDQLYPKIAPYQKAFDLYTEACTRGADVFRMATWVHSLVAGDESLNKEEWLVKATEYFRDYSPEVDRDLFVQLVVHLARNMPETFLPEWLRKATLPGSSEQRLARMFERSVLADQNELMNGLKETNRLVKKVERDPLFRFVETLHNYYHDSVFPVYYVLADSLDRIQQNYMSAQYEQKKGRELYPDANFTLRVSYGKVEGYRPRDGVVYRHYTTLEGIMEKEDPAVSDYLVPETLKRLYQEKDYSTYATQSSDLPVCFIASNHTTGGNSGSPVLDSRGNLIGINFDRCWEGTMSDLAYDPNQCRNIALDVRYLLFVIDKYAGAGYLLDEMKIIE
ncbi:MAG TPA: S46 family peptidase [Prolixibacteraceae bacterium]|nr:S46 family peptidase [Prolixibacteraceae bacterium]